MCDSWRKPPENELSVSELDGIFASWPRLDAVRLTGGEPFVRKDLGEIARVVQRRLSPFVLHVTTNGFGTRSIVRFCEERERSAPLALLVSVDGWGDAHSRIRGKASAWERVVETLRAIAPRQDELGVRLAVNQTVVDAEGLDSYRKLRAMLAPLRVRHQMVVAYEASATYSLTREVTLAPRAIGDFATFGSLPEETIRELLDEADHDTERLPLPERVAKRYYLRGLRSRLLGEGEGPRPRCVALSAHVRVLPDGRVPTCQFDTRVVGSLREQTLTEIWRGDEIDERRAWVAACPGCWAECEVLPNATYTGDLARALVPETLTRPRAPDAPSDA
jgi:MoaA/NifB/PqqE/SkfB family radical SAM enzyme